MEEQYDFMYKIVLIGDSSVGKTNLFNRFVHQDYVDDTKPTVGVEFATRPIKIDGKNIVAQVWDTAGQEKAITQAYYRGAAGAMICFDITKQSSYDNIDKWIEDLDEWGSKDLIKMLIGTKLDLEAKRVIRQQDAIQKALSLNMAYMETSALKGKNVLPAFNQLVEKIFRTYYQEEVQHRKTHLQSLCITIDEEDQNQNQKKGCC